MRQTARSGPRTIDPSDFRAEQENPYAGSSLVPMLISGLVLTFVGMVAALALS